MACHLGPVKLGGQGLPPDGSVSEALTMQTQSSEFGAS